VPPPPLSITFLGTRDGARSPRTNTSAQLVERGDVGLLVDAGLGATRQLLRAGVRPADLEGLLLTHWHPDHVGGLVPLLRRRWTARAPRLPVFGPSPPRVLAPLVRHGIDLTPARPGEPVELAGFTCTPFVTHHGPPSCGWVLEDPDGRRVAIPGDTRPVPGVVEAVRGVDVLVYEATFAAHHAERAVQSGHSTATEAGELAAAAGVGALVLTHLSNRYPRAEVGDEAAARHAQVVVPNDLDRLLVDPVPASARVGTGWAAVRLEPAGGGGP
jgi:ribonuclease Z